MKQFTINCDFGGQMAPFTIYVGTPKEGNHPLRNQSQWLTSSKGGVIPNEIMESLSQLQDLSKKSGVPLGELCVYALGVASDVADGPQERAQQNQKTDNSREL